MTRHCSICAHSLQNRTALVHSGQGLSPPQPYEYERNPHTLLTLAHLCACCDCRPACLPCARIQLRNVPVGDALMIKENATKVGGLLTRMFGMRQKSSDDAPRIVQGAVRVTINPPSFPKDSEESYVAAVTMVYGQPNPDVSIMQEFMRMMHVAATATATRDSIPEPAPEDAEAQQRYEAAKQQAEQIAADGAAAVSKAVNQPGLHALSKNDLAVVEIKGLTVATGQSKEGTKYYVNTFSSAAAAALAGIPLYVCDGSKVVRVEPLRMLNPEEMKYAMLYRAPSAGMSQAGGQHAAIVGARDAIQLTTCASNPLCCPICLQCLLSSSTPLHYPWYASVCLAVCLALVMAIPA